MRCYAAIALLAASAAAECWEEIGNRYCDGDYVDCDTWEDEVCDDTGCYSVESKWCWEYDPLGEVLEEIGNTIEDVAEFIMDPESALEDAMSEAEDLF